MFDIICTTCGNSNKATGQTSITSSMICFQCREEDRNSLEHMNTDTPLSFLVLEIETAVCVGVVVVCLFFTQFTYSLLKLLLPLNY